MKKVYSKPSMSVHQISPASVICGSINANSTTPYEDHNNSYVGMKTGSDWDKYNNPD